MFGNITHDEVAAELKLPFVVAGPVPRNAFAAAIMRRAAEHAPFAGWDPNCCRIAAFGIVGRKARRGLP